jgi:hypothetical protein
MFFTAVILIQQSREKDLSQECDSPKPSSVPRASIVRFLAPLGMTIFGAHVAQNLSKL